MRAHGRRMLCGKAQDRTIEAYTITDGLGHGVFGEMKKCTEKLVSWSRAPAAHREEHLRRGPRAEKIWNPQVPVRADPALRLGDWRLPIVSIVVPFWGYFLGS